MPLAHVFARIIEIGCLESGAVLGHWEDIGTVAEGLREFRPTFLLAVPRVFEKVYNTAQQQASASPAKSRIFAAAAGGGHRLQPGHGLRQARPRPAGPARALRSPGLRQARAAVGGKVTYAVSGGAPLGERLGHFFRGAGITVLEGYGMTETSAAATVNKPSRNKVGTVGQPLPGVDRPDRGRRRDPAARRHHLRRLLAERRRHQGSPRRRRLAAYRAISARSTRRASCGSPAARRS